MDGVVLAKASHSSDLMNMLTLLTSASPQKEMGIPVWEAFPRSCCVPPTHHWALGLQSPIQGHVETCLWRLRGLKRAYVSVWLGAAGSLSKRLFSFALPPT